MATAELSQLQSDDPHEALAGASNKRRDKSDLADDSYDEEDTGIEQEELRVGDRSSREEDDSPDVEDAD